MYGNPYQFGYARFSHTRVLVTSIMAGCVGTVMLSFMRNLYSDSNARLFIITDCRSPRSASVGLVRSHVKVGDLAWMKAVIPHHSIAILTSVLAKISGRRVRNRANGNIGTERHESGPIIVRYILAQPA
jgi:hypothetical protein